HLLLAGAALDLADLDTVPQDLGRQARLPPHVVVELPAARLHPGLACCTEILGHLTPELEIVGVEHRDARAFVADQAEIAPAGDVVNDARNIPRHDPMFGNRVFHERAIQAVLPRSRLQSEQGLIERGHDLERAHSVITRPRPIFSVYSQTRLVTAGRTTIL